MKYKYSRKDIDNINWFKKEMSNSNLTEINIRKGSLRGLSNFHIKFEYPISVIAGKNGSGKSTILALAACAYHNKKTGFHLPERNTSYYTYSDFFIQTAEEIQPGGVEIWYRYRHNNWKKTKSNPTGSGNLFQKRTKKQGGKWTNYSSRVNRNVVFLGIQRIVPHSEKSVSKSYRNYFIANDSDDWVDDVKKVVGRILGTNYDTYCMKTHGKYRLPLVELKGNKISGFNMGAGENALFEIFSTIYASPIGTLLVVDEIELGLHEKAQKKLIIELKNICKQRKLQVICTTHSPAILDSVPPEGRFFIEPFISSAQVIPGIASKYAAGKLSGINSNELDIFVEDGVASTILESTFNNELRNRVSIIPIGSHIAITRQMASRYKERDRSNCIAVLDGDQSSDSKVHISNFLKALEKNADKKDEEKWFSDRLFYLPGNTWPEKWLIEKLKQLETKTIADLFKCSVDELDKFVDEALTAEKHNEIFNLSKNLSLDINYVKGCISNWISAEVEYEFRDLISTIYEFLD